MAAADARAESIVVSARERRTIAWGVAVALMALIVMKGVVPFVAQWRAREARIASALERTAQLRALTAQTPMLAQNATIAERELAGSPRRALHARTLSLAASGLQALLQEASDGAGLAVNRVEALADSSSDAVSATLSVTGDIHGLAALLATLEHGPRVLTIEKMSITQNTALRGAADVLQLSFTVRAPVVIE